MDGKKILTGLSPNWKQIFTALKAALATGGPSIISFMSVFGYSPSDAEKVVAGITTIVGIVLLILDKSDARLAKDAASLTGVQVHVDPQKAAGAVVEAIHTTTDVVPMTGAPVVNEPNKSS